MAFRHDLEKLKEYLEGQDLSPEYAGEERKSIMICVEEEHMEEVSCYINVSRKSMDSDALVCISCYDFEKFDNEAVGLFACNKANDESVVAKFYIDEDGDPVADYYCWYEDGVDEEHFYRQLRSFVSDMDDAYVLFEKCRKLGK